MDRAITRRLATVPSVTALFVLLWLGAPLILPVAVVVDGVRRAASGRPPMATRLTIVAMVYSLAEIAGLIALGASWIACAGGALFDLTPSTFAIQKAWAATIFRAVTAVFSLDVRVDGADTIRRAPYLILARHASIIDNLLAAVLISRPHGIGVRYVMKRELLVDPALDVAGHRLPNVFISRSGADSEADAIGRLGATMSDREATLIYPEGTRFTAQKRDRALRILRRRHPELHEAASTMMNVLPPRPAGTLALLDATVCDVVFMAHRGLDGFARVVDIWRGSMVGSRVDVWFRRVPRADIPSGRDARIEWLFSEWTRMDAWIGRGA